MEQNSPSLPCVFVVGDSISVQYGPFLEKFLAGKFRYDHKQDSAYKRAGDNLDIPQGANGGDSAMVLAYLRDRRAHAPIRADVLMFNCGLHDIITKAGKRQIPEEQYANNLRACLVEAAAMHLNVIWVRTTPVIDEIHNTRMKGFQRFSADVAAYNEIADRIMREAGVPVIDLHAFSAKFLPGGFCDHVHYTEEVRSHQAAFLAGALEMKKVSGSNSTLGEAEGRGRQFKVPS